jgi:hypothetical protein
MKFERTRASDARPAMAIAMCESISMIFFWYEESSSALRCGGPDVNFRFAGCFVVFEP